MNSTQLWWKTPFPEDLDKFVEEVVSPLEKLKIDSSSIQRKEESKSSIKDFPVDDD